MTKLIRLVAITMSCDHGFQCVLYKDCFLFSPLCFLSISFTGWHQGPSILNGGENLLLSIFPGPVLILFTPMIHTPIWLFWSWRTSNEPTLKKQKSEKSLLDINREMPPFGANAEESSLFYLYFIFKLKLYFQILFPINN